MPTKMVFAVSADGSEVPTTALTINANGVSSFVNSVNYTPSAGTAKLQYADTVNGFINPLIQNLSDGTAASSDLCVVSNQGSDTVKYGNIGINCSGWTGTTYGAPADVYLAAEGGATGVGSLLIGTSQASTTIKFSVGNGFLNSTSGICEMTATQNMTNGILDCTQLGGNLNGFIYAISSGLAMP
jgi:hypothetical protein